MYRMLTMGGYGMYVWPAYGLLALMLILNVWLPRRQHRKILQQLKRQG